MFWKNQRKFQKNNEIYPLKIFKEAFKWQVRAEGLGGELEEGLEGELEEGKAVKNFDT